MQYSISLDWFQLYCHCDLSFRTDVGNRVLGPRAAANGRNPYYTIHDPEEFHSIYRSSFTIKLNGFPICHIHFRPKSSALDPHSCAVKVANRLLYSSTWSFHLFNVIDALGWEVKNLTRVDLACDFTHFANGQHPSEFIHHYLRDTNSADTETYIRRGSNKFCAIGTKRMLNANGTSKIGEETKIESIVSAFDYLRFGTRQSGVSAYLYNKSAELREKHSKPWIRQSWIDAGLIKETYEEGEQEPDVYRCELSIQAKGMNVQVKNSADSNFCDSDVVRRLQASDFATQLALEETWWAYQNRYFSFKVCTGQKYRKDMKELQLFEPEIVPTIKPCYLNRATDSGRAERNAASAISRLRHKSQLLSTEQQEILMQAANVLQSIGVMKKYDLIHDFSWVLDSEGRREPTKEAQAYLSRYLERIQADLFSCFRDPRLAEMVEEWEYEQMKTKELLQLEIECPDFNQRL